MDFIRLGQQAMYLLNGFLRISDVEVVAGSDVYSVRRERFQRRVNAYVGEPPTPYELPEESVPADLNWPLWLGPSEYVHYNSQLNPPISLDPGKNEQIWNAWRWCKELGGGYTTDWGAHMFDIAQWGLGMDKSEPVEIIPPGFGNTKYLTHKYANSMLMTREPFRGNTNGVKFWRDKGWVEISRDHFLASDENLFPKKIEKIEGAYKSKIPHTNNSTAFLNIRL